MKIIQQLPATCNCALCQTGCQCGDCVACSNAALDIAILRNAKRIAVVVCIVLFCGGFVFFVPVVSMGATPTITETFSVKVPAQNSNSVVGSIAFCYLGHGAVLVHGVYYPSAALNQSARRVCGQR